MSISLIGKPAQILPGGNDLLTPALAAICEPLPIVIWPTAPDFLA